MAWPASPGGRHNCHCCCCCAALACPTWGGAAAAADADASRWRLPLPHTRNAAAVLQRYVKCPLDLQQLQLEIVINEDTEREAQRQVIKVRACAVQAASCQA